jgi:cobalt-precorrin 5A hydrolase/precorrin-3B C17-methyltransferase
VAPPPRLCVLSGKWGSGAANCPLLEDKSLDPAVVVVDEAGQFVISLSSGHQGGADQLARIVALQLGATPVLTGASAGLGLPGVDILGVPFGWQRGEGDWTGVSAVVARGEPVQVIQEAGSTLWQSHLPQGHPFHFGFPEYPTTPPLPPLGQGGEPKFKCDAQSEDLD